MEYLLLTSLHKAAEPRKGPKRYFCPGKWLLSFHFKVNKKTFDIKKCSLNHSSEKKRVWYEQSKRPKYSKTILQAKFEIRTLPSGIKIASSICVDVPHSGTFWDSHILHLCVRPLCSLPSKKFHAGPKMFKDDP